MPIDYDGWTDSECLNAIAAALAGHVDSEDGSLPLCDHLGDAAELVGSVLHVATRGKHGHYWGCIREEHRAAEVVPYVSEFS